MRESSPIVIVGHRRSGTTMLRLMLTCHPDLCIPPENGFAVELGWRYGHRRLLDRSDCRNFAKDFLASPSASDWALAREQVARVAAACEGGTYAHLVDAMYREYVKENEPNKRRWGDKTTGLSSHAGQFLKYFPETQYVHIIRDPRAVAASFKKVPHLTNEVEQVALEWADEVRGLRELGRRVRGGRYVEVRYEALVADPERELRKLCRFLGEDFSGAMLQFWERNREVRLEPERHMDWKGLTRHPATTARIDAWSEELSNLEQRQIEVLVGPLLRDLDFDAIYPRASLRERGRAMVSRSRTRIVRLLKATGRRSKHRVWAELRRARERQCVGGG